MEKKGVRSVRRAITGEEFQAFDDNVCWDSSRVIRGILAEKEREERLYVSVDGRGDGFRPLRDITRETNEHRYFSYRLGVNPSRGGGMTDVRVIRDGEALSMIRNRRCKPVGRRDEAHVRGPCLLALP